jgi:hypothetical protein
MISNNLSDYEEELNTLLPPNDELPFILTMLIILKHSKKLSPHLSNTSPIKRFTVSFNHTKLSV